MRTRALVLLIVLLFAAITAYASTAHLIYLPSVFASPLPTPTRTPTVVPELVTPIP